MVEKAVHGGTLISMTSVIRSSLRYRDKSVFMFLLSVREGAFTVWWINGTSLRWQLSVSPRDRNRHGGSIWGILSFSLLLGIHIL